jgi:hypothetical protein
MNISFFRIFISFSFAASVFGLSVSSGADNHHSGVVLITGDVGKGTGFVARHGTETFFYSNAHVVSGNSTLDFRTLSNVRIPVGELQVSRTVDLIRSPTTSIETSLSVMENIDSSISIGDEVIVLGNSDGLGTVTELRGKVTGIGPTQIEIDAEFVNGNSGSPIIHAPSGKVIGVATFAIVPNLTALNTGTEMANVRRFGVRIDTAAEWDQPTWSRFVKEAQKLKQIESRTFSLFSAALALGDPKNYSDLDTMYGQILRSNGLASDSSHERISYAVKHILDLTFQRGGLGMAYRDRTRLLTNDFEIITESITSDTSAFQNHHFSSYHRPKFEREKQFREQIMDAIKSSEKHYFRIHAGG